MNETDEIWYEMYSTEGDEACDKWVEEAANRLWPASTDLWAMTYWVQEQVTAEGFPEVADTEPRCSIYEALAELTGRTS